VQFRVDAIALAFRQSISVGFGQIGERSQVSAKTAEQHLGLLADIGEISALLSESPDLQGFLDRCVIMVAEHLNAEVCSIYLYDEDSHVLTLRATHGLAKSAVGKIRLAIGEGLVGKALKELRPICVAHASEHPDFKYFPEAGEEPYEAFLGVPIQRGVEKIGILVAQRQERSRFNNVEVMAMRALTSQLATAIETARTLLQMSTREETVSIRSDEQRSFFVNGNTASPGYACGPSVQFIRHPVERMLQASRQHGGAGGEGDVANLDAAINATLDQLIEMQTALGQKLPEVASLIFEAHMMMLKDMSFVGAMRERIEKGESAVRAVAEIATQYIGIFEASSHDYVREKARDVEDLTLRLLNNLSGEDRRDGTDWRGRIVIARELLPSDILKITLAEVAGIIMVGGGLTSHISILVRSLSIPMIVADELLLAGVADGDTVLLDADAGNAYVNPAADVMERFAERDRLRDKAVVHSGVMRDQTCMKDGARVKLLANINLLSELDLALDLKAEGIGLYRTEFPFLIRQALPSEEEQYSVYSRLLKRMGEREVTIRTLDAGGDKMMAYLNDGSEPNPALGLRSTRLLLRHRDIFEQQLRAILRAGGGRQKLRILFPMICSIDEFRQARKVVEDCISALEAETDETIAHPEIGMMVELPSVVDMADAFAREADFFSIGTNDFIQYMLGVDRANARVFEYYCPHHPAVLRGLKRIADAAKHNRIECAVCGEMAHDTRYVPFFLGIGIRCLSVDPHFLPDVQKCVMGWTEEAAAEYAASLLAQNVIADIEKRLMDKPAV
jgi:phosphotransferase system enzyme I (PtsP)